MGPLPALHRRAAALSRAWHTPHTPGRAGAGSGRAAGCTRLMAASMAAASTAASGNARLAIVGDVHDQWSEADEAALAHLAPDMALFVGDFGNENVQLVQRVAAVETPKAVILGNHDAWYSMSASRQAKLMSRRTLINSAAVDLQAAAGLKGVPKQLAALGSAHVGYGSIEVPDRAISIVGARPFSKGGDSFGSIQQFMRTTCGVSSAEESTQRIVQVATTQVPPGHAIVMMGHNGPAGLGNQRHDIVGVDFRSDAGDHGDTDLTQALAELAAKSVHVSAVIFGHMHNGLRGGGQRRMVQVEPATGTVYLNAAVVPRVKRSDLGADSAHHFMLLNLVEGQVQTAQNVWVHVTRMEQVPAASSSGKAAAGQLGSEGGSEQQPNGRAQSGSVASSSGRAQEAVGSNGRQQKSGRLEALAARYKATVADEEPLLRTVYGENGVVQSVWDGFEQQWKAVVLSAGAAARHKGRAAKQNAQWQSAAEATTTEQAGTAASEHCAVEDGAMRQGAVASEGQQGLQQGAQQRQGADAKRARIGTAAARSVPSRGS